MMLQPQHLQRHRPLAVGGVACHEDVGVAPLADFAFYTVGTDGATDQALHRFLLETADREWRMTNEKRAFRRGFSLAIRLFITLV